MKGSRPEQAMLTKDTDPAKSDATRAVIEAMVDGLNDHRIDDIGEFFAPDFVWSGNQGCGTKKGLKEFQENWQRPFQAAFSDKVCIDEARLYMGEWAAAFGRQEAIHSGEFLGIAPTGKKVEIRYMDFWKVVDGKIVENRVNVDFPHVAAQLGVDLFNGHGWEIYDRGERTPPGPPGTPIPKNPPDPLDKPDSPTPPIPHMPPTQPPAPQPTPPMSPMSPGSSGAPGSPISPGAPDSSGSPGTPKSSDAPTAPDQVTSSEPAPVSQDSPATRNGGGQTL